MNGNDTAGALRGPSSGGLAGQTKVAKEECYHVTREIQINEDTVSVLRSTVQELEKRLSPILRATGPGESSPSNPEPSLVPLAETIRSQRKVTSEAACTLRDILNRIEL